jgi:glycosyltransferase involved in cell wall biosynthesis
MRVLFISSGFPPMQLGGTETYTAGLATALARRGHEVQVLCGGVWDSGSRYWNGITDEIHEGIPVRRVHVNWTLAPDPFRYLFDSPLASAFVRRQIEASRPDVVHVTSCERLSASVIPAAKAAGTPVVLSLTDFWFLCPRMTLLRSDGENCDRPVTAWDCTRCLARDAKVYRWLDAWLPDEAVEGVLTRVGQHPSVTRLRGLRGMIGDMPGRRSYVHGAFAEADCRITASVFVRDRFAAAGFDAPIRVQPYGHDLGWVARAPRRHTADCLRVGYIGQIAPHKGVHVLLEALQHLDAGRRHRLQVRVYGDLDKSPDYGARLRQRASSLPDVTFCGTYAHERTGEIFSTLDVLVVPSLWYDFPLIAHEAFAAGVPVVATRLGGMAETVRHGMNGLLFDRGDAAGLASALGRLVDDPALLERLRSGIGPVRPMDTEAQEMETVYAGLVPGRAVTPAAAR